MKIKLTTFFVLFLMEVSFSVTDYYTASIFKDFVFFIKKKTLHTAQQYIEKAHSSMNFVSFYKCLPSNSSSSFCESIIANRWAPSAGKSGAALLGHMTKEPTKSEWYVCIFIFWFIFLNQWWGIFWRSTGFWEVHVDIMILKANTIVW